MPLACLLLCLQYADANIEAEAQRRIEALRGSDRTIVQGGREEGSSNQGEAINSDRMQQRLQYYAQLLHL